MADELPTRLTPDDLEPRAVADMFATLGRHVAAQADTTSALQALVDVAVEVVPGARWASITRGRDRRFATMAASGPTATAADDLQYQLGTGPCLDAVINDAVFESSDLPLDDRWSGFGPTAARRFGIRSVLSLRLLVDGDDDFNAGLNVYADRVEAFDEVSRHLATLLAAHAAVAVAAVMHREVARQLQDGLDSNREIGVAMGILMATHKMTREQAMDLLRYVSQNTNRKLRDIATEVADTGLTPAPSSRHRR